jgi:putative phage-type endonuclease
LLSPEKKELRKKGIGGSDTAAILGLNPYKTAMQVWLEKTNRVINEEQTSGYAYWGNVLEDVIAREYAKATNRKIRKVNDTLFHPGIPWLLANIDRKVVNEPRVLECKTASIYTKKDWGISGTDHVPESYILQVQHYLAVTGYTVADLAVLIGGNDFRIFTIPRDDALIQQVLSLLSDFWNNHVLTDIPPQPNSRVEAYQRWPADKGNYIEAQLEHIELAQELKKIKHDIKLLENKQANIETKLSIAIGDSSGICQGDRKLITWKQNKKGSRSFRLC